jgi:hypothetical protein
MFVSVPNLVFYNIFEVKVVSPLILVVKQVSPWFFLCKSLPNILVFVPCLIELIILHWVMINVG